MSSGGRIVLCGEERALELARMLRSPVLREHPPIRLIGERPPSIPDDLDRVEAVAGDPTEDEVLEEAGVVGARTAVILGDLRSPGSPDARTLLVALAIEDLDRSVYTIAEVRDSRNIAHFDRTAVNETVCRSEVAELLVAQCALNHHASHVYSELLSYQTSGNELYRLPVAGRWATFAEAFEAFSGKRMIPVGLHSADGPIVNPAPDAPLDAGDDLWVVALEQPEP